MAVGPVFSSKLFVARSGADTFTGHLEHETFYFAEDDGELLTVLDEDGNVISGAPPRVVFVISESDVYDLTTVDYGNSTAAVSIDLNRDTQHGGFAEGDKLTNVYFVAGSAFDDVIRGTDLFTADPNVGIVNNPGNNLLAGGDGNDLLEGRGGADFLKGGNGSDTASYESSDAAVNVTVNDPSTGSFSASGGDAGGDTLESIENLIGSAFDDRLTGASNDNVLNGGLGNDIINGRGGTDTTDYSAEAIDHVSVQLADSVAGIAREFSSPTQQVSIDSLLSIENIIATAGGDTLTGNSVSNRLDGRGGDDDIDGGFGNDTLLGGTGTDTVRYSSHDSDLSQPGGPDLIVLGTVTLGVETSDGGYLRSGLVNVGGTSVITVVETDVLRGFENVTGSNRAETIFGNDLNNVIDGRGGNDAMDGGLGSDTLIGGDATGTVDTVSYVSHDSISLAIGNDVISLGLGGADGSYIRLGFVGLPAGIRPVETDVLRGIENVTGSNRSETITGNEAANTIDGRGGSDIIDGGFGDDILIGGDVAGTVDTVSYVSHGSGGLFDSVVIALGLNGADGSYTNNVLGDIFESDVLRGFENVIGSDGSESIIGNELNNTIDARGGFVNIMDGGLGNDILIGTAGSHNMASFRSHDLVAGVVAPDIITLGLNNADGSYVRFGLVGTTGAVAVVETDVLRGSFENVTGSNRTEVIFGNELGNTIDGRGGNDTIDGGLGNDTLNGGNDGTDTVSFVSHDSITLAVGADVISLDSNGAIGTYTRFGGTTGAPVRVERDQIFGFANVVGSNRAETINGNELANTLAGRGGNDTVNGGDGNDTYDFRGANLGTDTFFDTSGADRILINDISDVVDSHRANGNDLVITTSNGTTTSVFTIVGHFAFNAIEKLDDTRGHSLVLLANGTTGGDLPGIITGTDSGEVLEGRGGDDYLFANGGDDQLFGGADDDILNGGKGDDLLDGGSGDDTLTGGKGRDIFVFGPVAADGLPTGNDVIVDFHRGQDRIDLTAFHIESLDRLLDDHGSHGHGKHGGHHEDDGPITVETDGDDTVLSFDGGSIRIVGVENLHANDFIV